MSNWHKIIGPGLQVEEDTFLGPLAIALEEDMSAWSAGLHTNTVWERLTQRLIGAERRGEHAPRLRHAIAVKLQHARLLGDVAEQGARLAWSRAGEDSDVYLTLQDIMRRAGILVTGLEDLVECSALGNGMLKRQYDVGRLLYQCT